MKIIDATLAYPIFVSSMVETHYNKYINNAHLAKKLSYTTFNIESYDNLIRKFLKNNNREVPENAFVRLSAGGSSLCILAHYYAIWKIKGRTITVGSTVPPPYYLQHRTLAEFTGYCTWVEDNDVPVDLEIDISPNNPNGSIQPPNGRGEYVLLDAVYDYYNFTGTHNSVNPWVNYDEQKFCCITSISKFGLAGSRIGMYMSSNHTMVEYMQQYMSNSTQGTNTFSIDTLKCIIKKINIESEFIKSIYKQLQWRIKKLRKIIPPSLIYSDDVVPFMFVKINFEFFTNIGILVRKGDEFSVSNEYSRIQLMMSDEDFAEMVRRLRSAF